MKKFEIIAAGAFAAVLGAGAIALPALAHHAVNSQFDVTKTIALKGTLTKVELINPHSYVYFEVKASGARNGAWAVQSGAPAALRRAGISARDALIVGQTYDFTVSPSRNGSKNGLMSSLTLPDGRFFAFSAVGNVEQAKALNNR